MSAFLTTKKQSGEKLQEIAFLGNPNSGKTTLFNALTGLRSTTGNYPGVTVEKKVGRFKCPGSGEKVQVLDLPGSYSLLPRSLDEEVVHNVLYGLQQGTPAPDLLVFVIDANNLQRNLYLATQVLETAIPVIFVFNMWDMSRDSGYVIDLEKISKTLGAPCVKTIANRLKGIDELKKQIEVSLSALPAKFENLGGCLPLPDEIERELDKVEEVLAGKIKRSKKAVRGEALRLLACHDFEGKLFEDESTRAKLVSQIEASREKLLSLGHDPMSFEPELRYKHIEGIVSSAMKPNIEQKVSVSDRIDRIVTHKFFGLPIFAGVMLTIFQAIFSWAGAPMDWISSGVSWLGETLGALMPTGQLQSLVVDGMIAGVGNVMIFLPQIFLLFFFIALLEDFGYMARAAFVLDRLMKKVGLNGKAFLPLLSSFACAVPGVMATRTIEDKNDRLATILVAPLMSCSARIPVYTLMIGAFIPAIPILGGFDLKGLTLFSMYFLSIVAGLTVAAIFRKTFLKGEKTPFIFELPPYRLPDWRTVFLAMWTRGKEFIYRAGTIIFCISIVLWFLVSYPKNQEVQVVYLQQKSEIVSQYAGEIQRLELETLANTKKSDDLRHSFAGRLGHFIEPVIRPLGFDWKIGVGLVASFAAREVLVSTLAIVYNVGGDADESSVDLIKVLQSEKNPETGEPLYTPLVAVSLMVFFVLACQCMSTIAIVKRETGGWKWPIFMFSYMTLLAWGGSFVVFQGGRLLGLS